jgi:hypothetical protein
MKYVLYDINDDSTSSSNIKAFYDDDMHGTYGDSTSTIPIECIPMSNEAYTVLSSQYSKYRIDTESKTICPVIVTPLTLDQVKSNKKNQLSAYRYKIETGGVALGGNKILTDRESQSMTNGALSSLKNGLLTSIDWKSVNGWVSLTIDTFTPVAQAVATHVQGCFTNEKVHSDKIDSLSDMKTVNDYDFTANWPPNV